MTYVIGDRMAEYCIRAAQASCDCPFRYIGGRSIVGEGFEELFRNLYRADLTGAQHVLVFALDEVARREEKVVLEGEEVTVTLPNPDLTPASWLRVVAPRASYNPSPVHRERKVVPRPEAVVARIEEVVPARPPQPPVE